MAAPTKAGNDAGTASLDDLTVDKKLGEKIHPYAAAFPMLKGKELTALVKDIREHGLHDPIEYLEHNGEKIIVDGRNRLLACSRADVEPRFWKCSEAEDDDRLLGYVWSKNVHRRDLNASQRAMLVAERKTFIAAIAASKAEAKRANLKRGNTKTATTRKPASVPPGKTVEIAARVAKVGKSTMEDAVTVTNSGDESLVEEVKSGQKSAKAAAKEVRTKRRPTKVPAKKSATTKRTRMRSDSGKAMAHKLFARHDLEWIAEMAEELGVLIASSEKS